MYVDEQRAAMGKHAAENGNVWAVRKYSKDLGFSVPESTIRSAKKKYLAQLSSTGISLDRGKPIKLGWLDAKVQT